MPGFVCQRSADAAIRHFATFGVERCRYDNGFDAFLAEFGISQDAVRKLLVAGTDSKTLFYKAIDTNWLAGNPDTDPALRSSSVQIRSISTGSK